MKDKTNKIVLSGIIVEQGLPGTSGETIDLKGMEQIGRDEVIFVTKGYEAKPDSIIGEAKVRQEDNKLIADITLYGKDIDGYPAVCGIVREREGNVVTKFELTSIAICGVENSDKTIKKLSEQIKPITNQEKDIVGNSSHK